MVVGVIKKIDEKAKENLYPRDMTLLARGEERPQDTFIGICLHFL